MVFDVLLTIVERVIGTTTITEFRKQNHSDIDAHKLKIVGKCQVPGVFPQALKDLIIRIQHSIAILIYHPEITRKQPKPSRHILLSELINSIEFIIPYDVLVLSYKPAIVDIVRLPE